MTNPLLYDEKGQGQEDITLGEQICNQGPALIEANDKLMKAAKELTERTTQLTESIIASGTRLRSTECDSSTILIIEPDLEKRLCEIEELIEEKTNRQLRKTLIIRGVPEIDTEKILTLLPRLKVMRPLAGQ